MPEPTKVNKALDENPLKVLSISLRDLAGLIKPDGTFNPVDIRRIAEQLAVVAKFRAAFYHEDLGKLIHSSAEDRKRISTEANNARVLIDALINREDWDGLGNLVRAYFTNSDTAKGFAGELLQKAEKARNEALENLEALRKSTERNIAARLPNPKLLTVDLLRACKLALQNDFLIRGSSENLATLSLYPTKADRENFQHWLEIDANGGITEIRTSAGAEMRFPRPDKALVGFISKELYQNLRSSRQTVANLSAPALTSTYVQKDNERLDSSKLILLPKRFCDEVLEFVSTYIPSDKLHSAKKKDDPLKFSDIALVTVVRLDDGSRQYVIEGTFGHEGGNSRKSSRNGIQFIKT